MASTSRHAQFAAALTALADQSMIAEVSRYFRDDPNAHSADNRILGVHIGDVFPVAKAFVDLSLRDIEKLLENRFYEIRMGAVSVMDLQARAKRVTAEHRQALYELYLRRHDRINNWDMVDRAAPHVVGGYLADKPRDVLYELARSQNPWERRTAIVSTYFFIRQDDLEDTFRIAELLVHDPHDLVQKAVGSWIREAGKRDQARLVRFLDAHASTMPRATLRSAVEHLPATLKTRFMG